MWTASLATFFLADFFTIFDNKLPTDIRAAMAFLGFAAWAIGCGNYFAENFNNVGWLGGLLGGLAGLVVLFHFHSPVLI